MNLQNIARLVGLCFGLATVTALAQPADTKPVETPTPRSADECQSDANAAMFNRPNAVLAAPGWDWANVHCSATQAIAGGLDSANVPMRPRPSSGSRVSSEAQPIPQLPEARQDSASSTNTVGMTMVAVVPGQYLMGSPTMEPKRDSDEAQHIVEVANGFLLSATEVTQAQWEIVMGTNPSQFKGADLPVESVSWLDAVSYCNKLSAREGLLPVYAIQGTSVIWDASAIGYRLPTEAEWEYACRAGATTAYSAGDSEASLSPCGWYAANSEATTHPVGQRTANSFGLHDMHGNVWEWCWDRYAEYPANKQSDPHGAKTGTNWVLRGGSWNSAARFCRSAFRDKSDPLVTYHDLGFRVARNAGR